MVVSNVAVRFWLWWCIMQYVCVVVYARCAITPDRKGHVDIPSSWTVIPTDSFKECSAVKSVTIPDSVTSIGSWAFKTCTSLANVTILSKSHIKIHQIA